MCCLSRVGFIAELGHPERFRRLFKESGLEGLHLPAGRCIEAVLGSQLGFQVLFEQPEFGAGLALRRNGLSYFAFLAVPQGQGDTETAAGGPEVHIPGVEHLHRHIRHPGLAFRPQGAFRLAHLGFLGRQ